MELFGKILGIFFIIIGIIMIYGIKSTLTIYKRILAGKDNEHDYTKGKVICNAYSYSNYSNGESGEDLSDKGRIKITPIVEYEVDNKKYEGQNVILSNKGERPIGEEMKVWYKKTSPQDCLLEPDLKKTIKYETIFMIIGFLTIITGIALILM